VKKDVLRIIDANFNRSREGLRVCEDITRFALNSRALAGDLKSVRHRISGMAKLKSDDGGALYEARNSREDVGRCSGFPAEMKRAGLADIFAANIERVKESLRVLEELFKIIDKKISIKFAALRFRVYEIEKDAVKRLRRIQK